MEQRRPTGEILVDNSGSGYTVIGSQGATGFRPSGPDGLGSRDEARGSSPETPSIIDRSSDQNLRATGLCDEQRRPTGLLLRATCRRAGRSRTDSFLRPLRASVVVVAARSSPSRARCDSERMSSAPCLALGLERGGGLETLQAGAGLVRQARNGGAGPWAHASIDRRSSTRSVCDRRSRAYMNCWAVPAGVVWTTSRLETRSSPAPSSAAS